MSNLTDVISKINKSYRFTMVGNADVKKKEYARIPFVTPALTWLFYGGLPRGIVCELFGENNSGKSTISYSICGQAQKLFKQEYDIELTELQAIEKPNNKQKERLSFLLEEGEQKVLYVDTEFTSDDEYMTKLGIDVSKLLFVAPESQGAEEILEVVLEIVRTGNIGLVVVDSLAAMVSKAANDKSLLDKTMAGISACLTTFSDKILPLCNKYKTTVICTNQVRSNLSSSYGGVISPGGKGFKHACALRIQVRKGRYFDQDYKELTAHPETASGHYTEVEVVKNKVTNPRRRMTSFSINFDCGIDAINDAFEMGVTLGVICKTGSWYAIVGDDGNPIIDEEDNTLKFQGKKQFITYMKEHKEFTDDLINKINEESCK